MIVLLVYWESILLRGGISRRRSVLQLQLQFGEAVKKRSIGLYLVAVADN